MKIDPDKVRLEIEKRRREIELLERIDSDPDYLQLLETVLISNGNGSGHTAPSRAIRQPSTRETGRRRSKKYGRLIAAVEQKIADLKEPFSGYAIADKLVADGFRFKAKNPGLAVTETLRSMIPKGTVRVAEKGHAGKPTLYERIQ